MFKKARYFAFSDASFTHQLPSESLSLGMNGPVIRAVVGDHIEVTFLNELDFGASIHVHGFAYDRANEGITPVAPGEKFVYRWYADHQVCLCCARTDHAPAAAACVADWRVSALGSVGTGFGRRELGWLGVSQPRAVGGARQRRPLRPHCRDVGGVRRRQDGQAARRRARVLSHLPDHERERRAR